MRKRQGWAFGLTVRKRVSATDNSIIVQVLGSRLRPEFAEAFPSGQHMAYSLLQRPPVDQVLYVFLFDIRLLGRSIVPRKAVCKCTSTVRKQRRKVIY